MLKVYGIQSCDSCRKARRWLQDSDRPHVWHDLRGDGLEAADVQRWLDAVGPERLINRRSTTWRGLDEATREAVLDHEQAAQILNKHPTLIKRPVFEHNGAVHVGFTDSVRSKL
ncbi:Spx/MgsR family RNA polymerase-binding regulatory protein [Wenzhouxiangella sp. XN201]|uniref:Spx/MgsR family RNA polymerase-binding regulatory protein n=1 Tax=Wenzhouxiangella sp. XN201 TaxID=2710755 RepID=UPI0013C7CACC|nr:Spx/MgsR family RNA polymerase-binding regulatory protein [Wenzhouxiangella sp. XN201]NEZ03186.1 Spx/MgsR family RNA polymerase-binding regulatory protein [Wenzhouxiangella sp. XN201]